MTVMAKVPTEALSELDSLERLIADALNFNSIEEARYYEFDCQVLMSAQGSPIEHYRRLTDQIDISSRISDALGVPLAIRSLRFSAPGQLPRSVNWYDFVLEPAGRAPESVYSGMFVFRHQDRNVVWEMGSQTLEMFRVSANILEGR